MPLYTQFGEYILLRKLATGGMADVHLAIRHGPGPFNKLVALKSILRHRTEDESFVRMFENEARIAARFHHPNLVTLYDLKMIDESLTMVLEYVPGATVADLAARVSRATQTIPRGIALRMVMDASHGLHHAHNMRDHDGSRLGIVHRDISPQNILVSYAGHVKVFDFGIARSANGDSSGDLAGVLAGKYAYMSPEQCHGGELDERSDVFSLGVILYELTTNCRLFKRANQIEVLRAITEEPIKAPSEVMQGFPRALERIVMACLERDPADRPATALELANSLRRYAGVAEELVSVEELGGFVSAVFEPEIEELEGFLKEAVAEVETLAFHAPPGLPPEPKTDPGRQAPEPEADQDLALEELAAQSVKSRVVADPDTPSIIAALPGLGEEVLRRARRLNVALGLFLLVAVVVAVVLATSDRGPATVEEEVVAASGQLQIHSEPSGATVFVDDVQWADETPAIIEASNEAVRVRVEADGYAPAETVLQPADPPGPRHVFLALQTTGQRHGRGVIHVVTDPRDATVMVDGIQYGTTTPLTVSDLSIGSEHTLVVVREGFETRTVQFELTSTAIREMQLDMVAAVDVGRLTVSTIPEGAGVTIAGEAVGSTPIERFPLIAGQDYEIALHLDGFQPFRTVMNLTPNAEEALDHRFARRRANNGAAQTPDNEEEQEPVVEEVPEEDDPYTLLPD